MEGAGVWRNACARRHDNQPCGATMTLSFHDDDERRAVVSNVDIDAIVRIMTDETKVFDVADNNLRAAASSCNAKDVNLHILSIPSSMRGKMSSDRGSGVGVRRNACARQHNNQR